MEKELTKREIRLLKREEKRQEYLRSIRYRKIKKTAAVALVTLLVAGGITFLIANSPSEENKNNSAKIEINPAEYDLGDISMSAGVVKKTFEIKNSGSSDLKIDSIWTSCHCTTAKLKVGDKLSPEFGMEAGLSFWSEKIAPDQTGYLEVAFDPAYHGHEGMGPVIRAVYLSTNAPDQKKVEARLSANVTE